MADYYPLISRALDGLSDKSPDMRRAVYERARSALMAQLQSLNPPLPVGEITRERLALDEAIDRVEAEHTPREAPRAPPTSPAPAGTSTPPPAPAAPAADMRRSLPEAAPPAATVRPEPARDPVPEGDYDDFAPEDALPPPVRERPRIGTVTRITPDQGRRRAIILGSVLVVVMGLIAAAAWLLRVQPSEFQEQPSVEASKAPEGDTKLSDRMTGDRPPAQTPAPAPATPGLSPPRSEMPVAQRAILYEENQGDPQNPKASPGRALWRLDALNPGQAQALETVVRANIEAPPAGLSLALSIRRNTDSTLPASHIIELTFTMAGDDPNRIVRDVGLLQFKAEEAVRGTPLAGLPVPVKDNVFLIGMSNLPGDMERNRELMLRRNWIDLPIRFASGQRAILSFEKGVSGDQVINDAFRQWQ
jgi:hypothetical protein